MKLQAKTAEAFESNLDIRSLVDQQINLAGLVRLLLNTPQQFLFLLQKDRVVTRSKTHGGENSDSDAA